MKTVHVGIVGMGWFGNFHLDNLKKLPGVEVDALVNTSRDKLEAAGKKAPGARLYTDYHDMLEQERGLDALIVCVTPARHGDLEVLAAQRGIHLFVEKPIGLDLAAVERTAAAIQEAGIIASVGYHERYNPELDAIRAYVAEHPVGLAVGKWIGGMPGAAWWRDKAASGGQIVEQCTHIFDVLRYILGDVEEVTTTAQTGLVPDVPHTVEDASASLVRFRNGALATILTGCYVDEDATPADCGFTLYGKEVTIVYEWGKQARWIAKAEQCTHVFPHEHHELAIAAFIEAVRTGDATAIRSSYADGARTLAATLAANRSLESGQTVRL